MPPAAAARDTDFVAQGDPLFRLYGGREVGTLGEEAVTGVDRVGSGLTGRVDHRRHIEQIDGGRASLTRHDRPDAKPLGGLPDP